VRVAFHGILRKSNFTKVGILHEWSERRGAYRVLVGKPEGRRPLGRRRRRWEYNIKMNLREVGWEHDWIDLAQDRDRWRAHLNEVMNLGFA
jgi:hypothetical protein